MPQVDQYGDPIPAGAIVRAGTGRLRHSISGNGYFKGLIYSPDGKVLASTGEDETACLWESMTGRLLHRFKTRSTCPLFSPDSRYFVAAPTSFFGGVDVDIWDVETGDKLPWPEIGEIRELAISPDGKWIVAISNDRGPTTVLRFPSLEISRTIEAPKGPPWWSRTCDWVAFTSDTTVLLANGVSVVAWDINTGQRLDEFDLVNGESDTRFRYFSLSPDCTKLSAVGSRDRLVGSFSDEEIAELKKRGYSLDDLDDPEAPGRVIAVSSVVLWDLVSGDRLRTFNSLIDPPSIRVGFTPDNQSLVFNWDLDLMVSPTVSADPPRAIRGVIDYPQRIQFFRDSKKVVTMREPDERVAVLVDLEVGNVVREFTAGPDWMNEIALSPDEARLAVATITGTISVLEISTGKDAIHLQRHPTVITQLAFSEDGTQLIAGGPGAIVRWDASTGKEIDRVKLAGSSRGAIYCYDQRHVAAAWGPRGGQLDIWDWATKSHKSLMKQPGPWMTFSKDGNSILMWEHNWPKCRRYELSKPGVYDEFDLPFSNPDPWRFWMLPGGRVVCAKVDAGCVHVAIRGDENEDRHFRLPDTQTIELFPYRVHITQDGHYLMVAATSEEKNFVFVWDWRSSELVCFHSFAGDLGIDVPLDNHDMTAWLCLGMTSQGHPLMLVARISGADEEEHEFNVHDLATGRLILSLRDLAIQEIGGAQAHHDMRFAFSPDCAKLACNCDNRSLIWDLRPLIDSADVSA